MQSSQTLKLLAKLEEICIRTEDPDKIHDKFGINVACDHAILI
jgi:hypothetical protein